uniref:Ribonucleoprotein, putative n=1 Tax=Theileria annulata TaxID=5874 RepID=A0A3B0N6N6_THEAN
MSSPNEFEEVAVGNQDEVFDEIQEEQILAELESSQNDHKTTHSSNTFHNDTAETSDADAMDVNTIENSIENEMDNGMDSIEPVNSSEPVDYEQIECDKQGECELGDLPCSPAPPVEIKLFVARIPKTHEESDLRRLFEEFGVVKDVIVIRDKTSNAHKNCAFVKMASICQADAAVRRLNNQRVIDSSLGAVQIRYATGEVERLGFTQMAGEPGVDEAKLFVGSLPKSLTEEDLSSLFKEFGEAMEVFVLKDLACGGNKGCGFVKMKYKEQALHAIKELNGKKMLEGSVRPLEVRFAMNKTGLSGQDFESRKKRNRPSGMNHPPPSNPPSNSPGQKHVRKDKNFGYVNYNNGNPRMAGPWKEYISPDGRFYYYNIDNGTTQWEVPKEFLNLNSNYSSSNYHNNNNNYHNNNYNNYSNSGGNNYNNSVGGDSSLFIFHIPPQWNNNDLFRTFSPFGRVVQARIAVDRSTNRSKGYAFVSYDNPESATQAVANMNGFTIMGKKLRVNYKTTNNRSNPY